MPFGLFGSKKEEKKPWELPNHPVYKNRLTMPYFAKLQGHMEVGQMVVLKGFVPDCNVKEADPKIDVFLSADGGREPTQIALAMHICFKEKKVILNTRDRSEWGTEVKKSLSPFSVGEKFDLRIRAHSDKFEIDVNGKDYAMFDHRLPLSTVDNISVIGHLTLCELTWGGRTYSVPFVTSLTGDKTLSANRALHIMCCPEKKKEGFVINLVNSKTNDILFHFNPRFKQKCIVRNSKRNDKWENEEREGGLPFEGNIDADVVIVNEKYSWQVYINDEKFCTFAHRGDPKDIDQLEVTGDVELLSVQVKKDTVHD